MSEDYEAGRRDGRIESIERMQQDQNKRLDVHEERLRLQEKITYGLMGAIALMEFLPTIRSFLG